MRSTLDVIKERRSIRKFKPEQIKEEELQAIIEAGLYAPSAINKQSWNFTGIQNKEILDELNVATKNVAKNLENEMLRKMGSNEKYNCFYHAPTVILVSGKDNERSKVIDCSAATQNMLLAAEALNIGSCWVELVSLAFVGPQAQELREKLNLPEGYTPLYSVLLGYKDMEGKAAPRKENTVQYIR